MFRKCEWSPSRDPQARTWEREQSQKLPPVSTPPHSSLKVGCSSSLSPETPTPPPGAHTQQSPLRLTGFCFFNIQLRHHQLQEGDPRRPRKLPLLHSHMYCTLFVCLSPQVDRELLGGWHHALLTLSILDVVLGT